MFDCIGWTATAIFTGSYFCRQPQVLRRVQALAAVFWLAYGVVIHSAPMIVANVVVALAALVSSLKSVPNSAPNPSPNPGT